MYKLLAVLTFSLLVIALIISSGDGDVLLSKGSDQGVSIPAELSYNLSLETKVKIGGKFPGRGEVIQTISSELQFVKLSESKDSIEFASILLHPEVRYGDERDELSEVLLSAPFIIDVNKNGGLTLKEISPKVPEDKVDQLLAMLKMLELRIIKDRPSWKLKEEDQIGEYIALYSRKGDEVVKRKLKYISNERNAKVISNQSKFILDRIEPFFKSLEMKEEFTLSEKDGISFLVRNKLTATRSMEFEISDILKDPDLLRKIRENFYLPSDLDKKFESTAKSSYESFESLSSKLKEILSPKSGKPNPGQMMKWSGEAALFLKQHPEALKDIIGIVSSSLGTDQERSVLIFAIQRTDTREAIEALSNIVGSSEVSPMDRDRAVVALGQVKDSSPLAYEALKLFENAEDVELKETALLGRGTLVGKMLEVDPMKAGEAWYELTEELNDPALSAREKEMLITSLSNSKHPELFDVVKKFTEDKDAKLRASAFYALRGSESKEVAEFLVAGVKNSKDAFVRSSAIDALSNMPLAESYKSSLGSLIKAESDPVLRNKLAKKLVLISPHTKEGSADIKDLLQGEKDPSVYKTLAEGIY